MLLLDLEKVNATVGPGEAVMNTLIGMGTVFVVLILISIIIFLLKFVPKMFEKKKAEQEAVKQEKPAAKAAKTTRTTAKKTTTKKAAAPKKPAAVKKPAEKKSPAKAAKKEAEQEMILQFGGREIKEKDLYERIQQIWIEGYGKKAEELKSLKVYVKPEEFTAYYVINDDVTGSIDL